MGVYVGMLLFCYSERTPQVPEAQVIVSPTARAVDVLLHLGLGYSSYTAHGISTDVYAVTANQFYGRTNLVLDATNHWFYFIPTHTQEPSQVDVVATLVNQDTLLVRANQVIYLGGLAMWESWHCLFHRVRE